MGKVQKSAGTGNDEYVFMFDWFKYDWDSRFGGIDGKKEEDQHISGSESDWSSIWASISSNLIKDLIKNAKKNIYRIKRTQRA